MGNKKRTVVLFGAGAAIPWGGPSTSCLTKLIKKSAPLFRFSDSQIAITEFVYDTLRRSRYKDINFETIINVIEEFIVHYAYFDSNERTSSISKSFFSPAFDSRSLDFSITGGKEEHNYKLEIPAGIEYEDAQSAVNHESPTQFYFQHLLSAILFRINLRVSHYSLSRKDDIMTGDEREINESFIRWYQALSADSVVRMYTLNYDRNFKLLADKAGITAFEGFEFDESLQEDELNDGQLNLERILSDFDTPIHYNLHGSTYWQVHPTDDFTELNNPWISLSPFPVHEGSYSEKPILQIDKGKNILISNIITGYQKTQKSFVTPFRQMQAAFDRDCILADEIIVVGYSFGDYHINSSIVNALKYNKKLRLHFIDPAYAEKDGMKGYDLLVQRLIHIFSDLFHFGRTQPIYSSDRDSCTYFDEKLIVSMVGFDQYLNKPLNYTQVDGVSARTGSY